MHNDTLLDEKRVPAALHLPFGQLFFGYNVERLDVPVIPKHLRGEDGSQEAREVVAGTLSVLAVLLVTMMIFWMRRTAASLSKGLRADVETAMVLGAGALVLTAFFAELPLAALLILGTTRIIRLNAVRQWQMEPHAPLWDLRMALG